LQLKRKNLGFRAWFYFRQGWSTYFAFIFAAINTMEVTYYLAIENIPTLKEIFPTFYAYLIFTSAIGIPLLVFIGYVHYKKVAAYHAEADITQESQPYNFKLHPGYETIVTFPLFLSLTNFLLKWSKDEKLTDEEINQLQDLQKKINLLIKGGYVGKPAIRLDNLKNDKNI